MRAVNLKASDIDSLNMQIIVRQGKGSKDRLVFLSYGMIKRKRLGLIHKTHMLWKYQNIRKIKIKAKAIMLKLELRDEKILNILG